MPPRPVHGCPAEWLRRAEASLALGKHLGEGILLEDLCYQAQQAAEKALKAIYISRNAEFLFTHDLDRLLLGLEALGLEVTAAVDQASILTRYAMDTRYPGTSEAVEMEEYLQAIRLAETVLAWARGSIPPEEG